MVPIKKYIEIKIMRRTLLLIFIIAAFICGYGGYYVWCSYHPDISIGIVMGGKGEAIKAEVPSVSVAVRHGKEAAAPIELKLLQFWVQYNSMNEYFIHNYKTADIKLDIIVKDGKTILKYSGTGTDLNDVTADYNNEIILDFVLDADIK